MTGEEWMRIEREACEQVRAELDAIEAMPLTYGQHVAWDERSYAKTDGLSMVHRVAVPQGVRPQTFCGELIPPAIRRLTLTPEFEKALLPCKWCQMGYAKAVLRQSA